MKYIPNLITSLNLTAGFIAIIFAVNGEIVSASWLILSAMIFDFLDGFSARMLKAYSDIGKELDSLADVVSFGVAPAMIVYHLLGNSLLSDTSLISDNSRIETFVLFAVPAIMVVCAALRLAVFNVDTTQSISFKGLPSPANALAIISLVLSSHFSSFPVFSSLMTSTLFLIVFALCLSLLMVSRLPLFSLKMSSLKIKGNEARYILVLMAIISFLFLGMAAAILIIPFYIIVSLIALLFKKQSDT